MNAKIHKRNQVTIEALEAYRKDLGKRTHLPNLRSSALWCFKALELKSAADTLRKSRRRKKTTTLFGHGPELVILGYAFEVLFKSFWVARNHIPDTGLPKSIKTHDLTKLVRLALPGRAIGPGETRLLAKLSTLSTWQGRYPAALLPESNIAESFQDFEVEALHALWETYQKESPDELINDILKMLAPKKGLLSD